MTFRHCYDRRSQLDAKCKCLAFQTFAKSTQRPRKIEKKKKKIRKTKIYKTRDIVTVRSTFALLFRDIRLLFSSPLIGVTKSIEIKNYNLICRAYQINKQRRQRTIKVNSARLYHCECGKIVVERFFLWFWFFAQYGNRSHHSWITSRERKES